MSKPDPARHRDKAGKLQDPAIQTWGAEHKPADSLHERGTQVGQVIYNLFNSERSLRARPIFKRNRAAALAEWRGFLAGQVSRHFGKRRLVRIRLAAPSISKSIPERSLSNLVERHSEKCSRIVQYQSRLQLLPLLSNRSHRISSNF